ncbi:MAG: hypothetical protein R3D62_13330 [Xanthobacteraceae bacterium]
MTLKHRFITKLLTLLPTAVAALAAVGAMMLVGRDWAPQVGLAVYFPMLLLMTGGFIVVDPTAPKAS